MLVPETTSFAPQTVMNVQRRLAVKWKLEKRATDRKYAVTLHQFALVLDFNAQPMEMSARINSEEKPLQEKNAQALRYVATLSLHAQELDYNALQMEMNAPNKSEERLRVENAVQGLKYAAINSLHNNKLRAVAFT